MSRDPRDIEIETLRTQLAAALGELARVRSALAEMSESHARMNDRLAEILAALARKKRSAAAPKPPGPSPTLEASQAAAFDARPKPPELPPKTPKKTPPP